MSRVRVFLKQFESEGFYVSDFTEITDDVIDIGSIEQSLDNSTYDIGIFKNSGLSLRLRNDHGRFGPPESSKSIFNIKRQDSIIRVTWNARPSPAYAGFFTCHPLPIGSDVTVFEGFLFDTSGNSSIEDQFINFRVNSYETIIDRLETPFSSISNGDLFSEAILTLLNQSELTDFLTVSGSNITCAVDETIDDKSSLEETTVKEALVSQNLLLAASSVLYVKDSTVYVTTRDASATNKFTFYGQAAINGIENIIEIKDFRDGSNKIFNFIQWTDTTQVQSDPSSITSFGIRKRNLATNLISTGSTSKIQNILGEIRDDFRNPKREFRLTAPITYETLELNLTDRVTVDYPTIYRPADENPIPRWGQADTVWGDFVWPLGQYSLTISPNDPFKIMGKKIDLKKDTIEFYLREI